MLIIDGHNLIGASRDIRLSDPDAKEKLIDKLKLFEQITNNKIIVVFDGRGYGDFEVTNDDNLEIRYPSGNLTADDVLFDLINKYSGNSSVKIISSDNQIIKEAKYHRLTSIKSNDFIIKLNKKISTSNQPKIDVDDWVRYFNKKR
ncbi:MAG: hypothetical protein ACD_58C00325G0003 [uncultured bacterium]|nr:MAG: hypothetical protein ACD_58C00325G0003 [uncultured bacterium]